ncbi:MAG TPA: hypothetical protein VMJ32_17235 [Pirellulales bacterium]|nr:hypothetical protein [Pirellulales bacterium]
MTDAKLAANRRNSFFKQHGGRAPDHYRCQTILKRTGERCKWWRCRFSKYCYRHGGRRSRGRGRNNYKPTPIYNGRISVLQGRKMPPIYRRYLKSTLSEAVRDLCAMPPHEQLQLFEELALMRDAAGQSVALYSIVREVADARPDDIEARQHVIDVASIMSSALMQVAKVVDRAAAVNANAKDKISLYTLQHFVDQLVVIAHETWGDDPRVEQFRIAVRDRVKIPQISTPTVSDEDVAAMVASVPECHLA